MRYLILIPLLAGCCNLCPPKIVEVPVPVPCPQAAIPPEPVYPILTIDATPKVTLQFCAQKLIQQEGFIEQLKAVCIK